MNKHLFSDDSKDIASVNASYLRLGLNSAVLLLDNV